MNRRNTKKPPHASALRAVIERLETRAMLAGIGPESWSAPGLAPAPLGTGAFLSSGVILTCSSPSPGSSGTSSLPAPSSGSGGTTSGGDLWLAYSGGSVAGGTTSGSTGGVSTDGPALSSQYTGGSGVGKGSGTSSGSGTTSGGDLWDSFSAGSGAGGSTSGSAGGVSKDGPVLSSQYTGGSGAGKGSGTSSGSGGTTSGGDLWLSYGAGSGAGGSTAGSAGCVSKDGPALSSQYKEGSIAGGQDNRTAGSVPNADLWRLYWSSPGAGSSSSSSDEGTLADDPTISARYTSGSGIGRITPLVYNPQSDGPPVFHSGVWTGDEGGVQFVQTADTGSGQDGGDPPAGRPAWNNDDVEDYYHGPRWLFEFEAGVGRYDPPKEIPKPRDELAGVVPTDPDGKYQVGRKQELDTLPTKVGEKGKEFAWYMADYIGPDVIGWAAKGLAGTANAGLYWFATIAKKADPLIDGARAVANAADEIQAVGRFAGKSASEIADLLAQRGYSWTRGSNGGTVWTKCLPDGNTIAIRIDPPKARPQLLGYADEVPHVHKEMVPTHKVTGGNYLPKHAKGLDDDGIPSNDPRATHIPGGQR